MFAPMIESSSLRVLLLSPYAEPGIDRVLVKSGDMVVQTDAPLGAPGVDPADFDWLVSYGYKFIVSPEAIEAVQGRAVNLHISLLPWNKGAHPNVWSFVEDTPKGVTIHRIDVGIDTGDIVAQIPVEIPESDTLGTSYARLRSELELLFTDVWPMLRHGQVSAHPQPTGGTHHYAREFSGIKDLMPLGWDTPVADVRRLAASRGFGGKV